MRLLAWLCDKNVGPQTLTKEALKPPAFATTIEANWLWDFLQRKLGSRALLEQAKSIAEMPDEHKEALLVWARSVAALADQFKENPPVWPGVRPAVPDKSWEAFRDLMESFYEKGLRSGLPFSPDGTAVASGGVKYKDFRTEFRKVHKLSAAEHSREICVLCGGPLGETPEVDHWVAKCDYPILSVCADNLLPTCGDCNSKTNKGSQPVHTLGNFEDWFHPYLRSGQGKIRLEYLISDAAIACKPVDAEDDARVANLDRLLKLSGRWTREFKAEYAKQLGVLMKRERSRLEKGGERHTQQEVLSHLQSLSKDLLHSEPHFEVHTVLCQSLLDTARQAAWQTELGLVQR